MTMGDSFLEESSRRHKESLPEDRRKERTMGEYIDILLDDPRVARDAHQRVADMFRHFGVEVHDDYVEYKLASEDPLNDGKNKFFGKTLHKAIDDFVNKIESGARRLGPQKRIKLLLGPVGSGKSDFDKQVREYFEAYTAMEAGRMYTFKWVNLCEVLEDQDPTDDEVPSPMNQDPLVLLPQDERDELLQQANEELDAVYTLRNEQSLDPVSQLYMERLMDYYDDELDKVLKNHVRVVRLVADENSRRCIETFEPKDKKNQDETELTGDVNYGKIAVYGESDPRAFDYSGAFCNANRGLFSGEELLKLQREFLYDFLHATQEQTIKPKNNPRIDIDQVIVGRSNMPEYESKRQDEKMEAFNDRTKRIDFPYTTEYEAEAKIYRKRLDNADIPDVSVEPHTLEMAALFGVLTRIEAPEEANITLMQKAKAYNGTYSSDEIDDVEEYKQKFNGEGMYGVSPRFIADEIANVIVDAAREGRKFVSPLRVLDYMSENLGNHGSIKSENVSDYQDFIELVSEEYNERATEDVRHALAYNIEELQTQGEKYMDHVMAYINDEEVEDEITGKAREPDEKFMRAVEEHLEMPEDRKDDFRQEVANWVSRRAREGETFDPHKNDKLRRALERKIWEDKKHNINFNALLSSSGSDEGTNEQWIETLIDEGYSREGAEKVLEVAGAQVAKSEMEDN